MLELYIRGRRSAATATSKLVRSLRDEKGEVNIVATVLLIVVAVGLIVLFREKLSGWITGMFEAIDGDVNEIQENR